ncbi:MAG TPA: substrate-binding domain-containing protein [Gaiellaceae bacterium]
MSVHDDQRSATEIIEALIANRAVGIELRERVDALANISRRPSMRDGSDRQAIGLATSFRRIESFHHPFYDDVFYGVRERACASGYDILYFTMPGWQWENTAPYVELCERYGLVGIVGLAFSFDEPGLVELLAAEFPCVAVDLQLLGRRASYVTSDNVSGSLMAVEHLYEIGRRRIAFIGGTEDAMTGPERRLGYVSALEKLGLEGSESLIRNAGWDILAACEQTKVLMAQNPAPDAIFCASDVMAIGALSTLEAIGASVPDDVAVVGFDDIDLARLVTPSLTTIHQDKVGLGAAAIEVMTRILERPDSPPPASVLPVELTIRDSTSGAPEGDAALGKPTI